MKKYIKPSIKAVEVSDVICAASVATLHDEVGSGTAFSRQQGGLFDDDDIDE